VGLGFVVLALLGLVGLPPFLRMPLGNDTVHYDLCARTVLRGGILYQDLFDTNLPGIVWWHLALRSLAGWSSEAMRLADLAIVSAIICLLSRWPRQSGRRRIPGVWVAALLGAFYFSTSEFCHAQRDVWMLLPALAAVSLRRLRIADCRLPMADSRRGVPLLQSAIRNPQSAMLEGLCWGLAVWIKPFVLLPALLCWAVTVAPACRPSFRRTRWLLLDLAGVLGGGLLAGCLGCIWLWRSGAWYPFWDVSLSWNGEYYRWGDGYGLGMRTLLLFILFTPWSAVHLLALPVAIAAIWPGLRRRPETACDPAARGLLGALYLGWVVQAHYIQHGFVYQHVPGVLLGLALVAGWDFPWARSRVGLTLLALFACLAAVQHPLLRPGRLALWHRCLVEKSGPELRDRLALTDSTDWQDLGRVAEYLRAQGVRDGEVTCFGYLTVHLYDQLGVAPSTRFTLFNLFLNFFPNHAREIRDELAASRQRFVVTDVREYLTRTVTGEQAVAERPGAPLALPPDFPAALARHYPWSEPVVFRAGRYLVHRAAGPVSDLSPQKS
jgi:hypothetical protein